jgi:integrase
MKPEKLKSGNWRCKVYLGTDNSGKKIFKSVTAPTKKEAIAKAAELALDDKKIKLSKLTVGYCIDAYVREKESELSPYTARMYRSMARHRFGSIRDITLDDFSARDVQHLISDLSDLSPKSKKNTLGLLTASLRFFDKPIDTSNVKIARGKKTKIKTPTHEQILDLIEAASGDLKLVILLGALCGMRRGEIFALRAENVSLKKKKILIDSSFMQTEGKYEIRPPKTESSNRVIDMPDKVCSEMALAIDGKRDDDLVVSMPMNTFSNKFRALRDSVKGCGNVRFHDLRHYYASALVAAGIPDIYAMKMGGWSTPDTLKRVYQDVFGDQFEIEKNKVNGIFNETFK